MDRPKSIGIEPLMISTEILGHVLELHHDGSNSGTCHPLPLQETARLK